MPRSAPAYCGSSSGWSNVDEAMNRKLLYLLCAALGVVVVVLGYQVYQDRQKPNGVEIKIDDSGISIQGN
jgi:hypothetical protein